MHLWRRLGIIQVDLASALALHKRSYLLTKLTIIFSLSPNSLYYILSIKY